MEGGAAAKEVAGNILEKAKNNWEVIVIAILSLLVLILIVVVFNKNQKIKEKGGAPKTA